MWIVIEQTAQYTLRARNIAAPAKVLGCLLVATTPGGDLLFAQFINSVSAEDIEAGW